MDPAAHRLGSALCIASAIAFGAMAIFGKLAYDAGVGLLTLLFVRFSIAAPVLWIAALRRPGALSGTSRRTMLAAFTLGAVGYSMQAALYFAALTRMDASLLSMLLYTFPAMVVAAAIALGRETANRRRTGALLVSSGGLALVLLGAGSGTFDWLGALLARRGADLHGLHPGLRPRRRRPRRAPAVGADHDRCGDDVRPRRHRHRLDRHRLRERGLAVAGLDRDRLDRHPDHAVLRRPAAGRPVDGGDPLDARAADHRRAGLPRLRRVADGAAAGGRRARARRRRLVEPAPAHRPRARGCARAPR